MRKPADVKPLADKAKAAGEPLTFAMTFPPGTHAMWMRYWLASGGIHPDKDVSLITIPPPQMVANMKVDKMDGFCVGEPWNNRAIEDGIGFTVITTQQMWKDHPGEGVRVHRGVRDEEPEDGEGDPQGAAPGERRLDKMENRPKFAEVISRPAYINCPPAIILERLLGKYEYGDGRVEQDPNYMIYSNRNCNYPHQIYGKWWLTQFRRWGMIKGAPDYAGIPKRVLRSDIYLEAMKEMGVAVKVAEEQSITLFDGVFDGKDPEKYAKVVPGECAAGIGDVNWPNASSICSCRSAASRSPSVWWAASALVPDLPSPARTWEESKLYILEPLAKRGEMDQGIVLLAYYSLVRVAQGFLLGIAIATPLGFLLGVSPTLTRMFDPIMQVLRPISPLAWLPLGLVSSRSPSRRRSSRSPSARCGRR